jgi:hypothetical protein
MPVEGVAHLCNFMRTFKENFPVNSAKMWISPFKSWTFKM